MAQGYTAPFLLQDILAQRRIDQHQKLVDSLNLRQAQAEMENTVKSQAQAEEAARATAAFRVSQLAESAADRAASGTESAADRASREKIALMPQREAPEQEMFTVGPTGKTTPLINPRTGLPIKTRGTNPLLELGFPPQPSAAGGPQLYQVTDSTTGTVESHWLRPGQQPSDQTKISGLAIRKGNEPTADTTKPSRVPPGLATKLATAKGVVEGSKGWWNPSGSAKSRGEYDSLVRQVVNYAQSPTVKQYVRQILIDPDTAGRTTEELVVPYTSILSPDELNEMRDVLSGVRGQ